MSATSRKRRPTSRKRCATSRKRRHRHSKKRRYRHSTFEEACNQADAEQARRLEPEEVARLARLSTLEYDRQREEAAKRLGVRVGTLDKAVWKKRALADNDDGALPHWKVEPSPEPVDGAALLNNLRQVFRRFIFLPKGADIALPLWVLHAWTYDAGDISPSMVLVSPTKRCGKTNVLILLHYLTPRSELASNISAAALFRYIEEVHPTLLIDEADAFVKDNEELRGILNSGHTKTAACVIRTVEINGEHKACRFSTWAPKAIATIRALADTLEDRAVVVQLQRKPPGAKVERLRKRDNEWFAALRSNTARWAADNFDRLVDADPNIPDALNDRAADNWRPLLAIADLTGGEWSELARQAALTLSGEAQESAVGVELLKDIRLAFGDDEAIRSADLVAKLTADPERQWAEWKRGKSLSQKQLGGLLRPFGICSETISIPGLNDAKGYKRVRFEEAWAAYCPGQFASQADLDVPKRRSVETPIESAQVHDFRSVAEASADGSKNGKLFNNHAGFDASTLRKPENGARSELAATETAPTTANPFGRRCDLCGSQFGDMNPYDWPGRPDGIWLHPRCEEPWSDCGSLPEGVR
jgi:putative DNA primase/helicase